MVMTALDWIFVAVLVVSFVIGAWRGLAFELLSLCGWIAAFFAAQYFADDVGAFLPMRGAPPLWRYAAGFTLVFISAIFACGVFAWLVKKMVESVGLRPADRALGGVFGVLRGGGSDTGGGLDTLGSSAVVATIARSAVAGCSTGVCV